MKLIDKSKLVEELKKLKQNLSASPIVVIEDVESLVESLEVKEVDLEKELDSMITPELKFHKALPSLYDVAKHFFELGLSQKGE